MREHTGQLSEAQSLLLEICVLEVKRGLVGNIHMTGAGLWELVAIAGQHKLLPVVGRALRRSSMQLSRRFSQFVGDNMVLNKYRQERLIDGARAFQGVLANQGIHCLARKGAIFDMLLYGGDGIRVYGDIDCFIQPRQAGAAEKVLQEQGYSFGKWDPKQRNVMPWPKERIAMYRLNPDHLPRFVKSVADPFVPVLEFDVALDVAWHRSKYADGAARLLEDSFSTATTNPQTGLLTATLLHHFFDALMHFYREAYFETLIRTGADVSLGGILDIALIWGNLSDVERSDARQKVHELGLEIPSAWVAHHVDALFGTSIIRELCLEDLVEQGVPFTWCMNDGSEHRWHGSMVDRIFSSDRIGLFDGLC